MGLKTIIKNRIKKIDYSCKCTECDKVYKFKFTEEEYSKYMRYKRGERLFIQDIFPNRSVKERELLRGGMCGECWNSIFGWEQ